MQTYKAGGIRKTLHVVNIPFILPLAPLVSSHLISLLSFQGMVQAATTPSPALDQPDDLPRLIRVRGPRLAAAPMQPREVIPATSVLPREVGVHDLAPTEGAVVSTGRDQVWDTFEAVPR